MDPARRPFDSLYAHGFARVAACVPAMRVADPAHNADATIELAQRGRTTRAVLARVPRARPDRLHERRPVPPGRAARRRRPRARATSSRPAERSRRCCSSARRCASSRSCSTARSRSTAARCSASSPKSLPAQLPRVLREAAVRLRARCRRRATVRCLGAARAVRQRPGLRGDRPRRASRCTSRSARTCGRRSRRARTRRWRARPCSRTSRRSNITIGKADYRHAAVRRPVRHAASPRTSTSAPGPGESTTDLAWDGHALIYENGNLLAESRALRRRRAASSPPTSTSTGCARTACA